jgi:outer membrane receptor for ferrienterochelin and colicins
MLLLVFFGVPTLLLAQAVVLSGTVRDMDGPLVGANVWIPDAGQATFSGRNGEFRLSGVSPGVHELQVSFLGYQTKRMRLTVGTVDTVLGNIVLVGDFLQLEQVVLTGTRSEVLRKDAPIVCSVLDARTFDATQSVTLAEGLGFQPALRIENNCQSCGFSSLRMNGLEGAYSQILLDGRPIFSSLQGVYGLEQIPANMIERIEVVRSGGSALYGSSAVAGTVNVITREPDRNGGYVTLNQSWIDGAAPDRTLMAGTDVVRDNRKAGFTLNGFNRDRAYWDSNGDGFSEIPVLKSSSLAVKAFYNPGNLSKITINGLNVYEFRRGGNKFDVPFHQTDVTEAATHHILNGGITFEQFTRDEQHKLALYASGQRLYRDSYYGSGGDENAYGNSMNRNLVAGLQYTGKLHRPDKTTGKHTVVAGMELNEDALEDRIPSYDRFIMQTARQLGIYVQDMWEPGERVRILAGGRMDVHNFVPRPVFSPRANVMFALNRDLQLRLGYAKGFRAPQVFDEDLHITQVGGGGVVIRNAASLRPEYSDAFSASMEFNRYAKNWSLGLTLDAFHTRLREVFVLQVVSDEPQRDILLERSNGAGATVSGITLHPRVQYRDRLSLQAGITVQRSVYDAPVLWSASIENTDPAFFRAPNVYGFHVLSWRVRKSWELHWSGVLTGSMRVQHYAGFVDQDRLRLTSPFWENNIKLQCELPLPDNFQLGLSAGVQNLTNSFQTDLDLGPNRDAGYVYGPGRPRTFFLGANIRF